MESADLSALEQHRDLILPIYPLLGHAHRLALVGAPCVDRYDPFATPHEKTDSPDPRRRYVLFPRPARTSKERTDREARVEFWVSVAAWPRGLASVDYTDIDADLPRNRSPNSAPWPIWEMASSTFTDI